MKTNALFINFYSRIADDARISPSRISLYLALMLVEIEVTHPVDEEKLEKIRQGGYAVVAVDVREMVRAMFNQKNYSLTDEKFHRELIHKHEFKRWSHNPKYERIEQLQKAERVEIRRQAFIETNYIRDPKGKVMQFKSFITREGDPFFYVENCPKEANTWKTGYKAGKPYATDEDCDSCVFCNRLERKDW